MFIQPLNNDYIKFLRFAQWKIVEKTHHGIVGMITDNSYLDGLIHRGIRGKLLDAFNQVVILNLHGNSRSMEQTPKGQKDENVFEIQQGVAIVFLIKNDGTRKVLYADLWGSKEEKYKWLSTNDFYSTNWQTLDPKSPFFWFFPKKDKKEYQDFPPLDQIMPFHQQGVKTHRDWLVVGYEDAEINSRIESLRSYTEDEILAAYNLSESHRSSVSGAKELVQALPTLRNEDLIDYLYRPFDNRRLYYNPILIDRHRPSLARQDGTIFLITRRNSRQWRPNWTFAFVTKNLPDIDMRGGVYSFPMKVDGSPNFSRQFLDITAKYLTHSMNPLDILGYIYAIPYCNEYREEYSVDLRFGFPRIPVTADQDLFTETSNIGKTLVQVHLLEDPELDNLMAG
jgi:predicted helicase